MKAKKETDMAENKKALLLDLHIPYCIQPENYLDHFNAIGTNMEKNMYLTCMGREILSYEQDLEDYEIQAVRMSGGSASVMSPDLLGKVLTLVREKLPVARGAQVSYDALPNTIGTPHLTGIAAGHPNRVELMMRSENDQELRTLNCPFTMQDTRNAMLFFGRFHMNNVGLTVNYGIPGQTAHSWHNTLHSCVIMRPGHIRVQPLDQMEKPEEAFEMYTHACEYLAENGYIRYGIGLFCLPGHEDRYEVLKGHMTPYIGMGVGNSSLFEGYLIRNTNNLNLYMKNSGSVEKLTAQVEQAAPSLMMKTWILNRLSLSAGISEKEFETRFSTSVPENIRAWEDQLLQKQLAEESEGRRKLTLKGEYQFREICRNLMTEA